MAQKLDLSSGSPLVLTKNVFSAPLPSAGFIPLVETLLRTPRFAL